MTVDIRTRTDRVIEAVDPAEFLHHALPELFGMAADRLAQSVRFLSPRPLSIDVGGAPWTLSAAGDAVQVRPGLSADAGVLHLDAEQLGYFIDDQATPMTWLTAGTLRLGGGARLEELLDWWLLLRSAIDGSTPHVPGALDLADGDAPDVDHVFAPDDPAGDMASFLERYGFLHIGGLFTEAEMAAVSAEMDIAAPRYSQGDGRSWWATLSDGSDALVRMQGFDLESPAVAALVEDERLQRIGRLTGDGHEWGQRTDNKIEALFKPLGVVRGISDIPWHKDCSLGRHSYDCCALNVGISVTGADAVSGQLRVVAGSHRAHVWPAPTLQAGLDLPVVDLPTRTGDITVHLSCTLHMAQAPVERERRVMYSAFSLPAADQALADESRRRIREARELAPTNAPHAPVVDAPHLDRAPA